MWRCLRCAWSGQTGLVASLFLFGTTTSYSHRKYHQTLDAITARNTISFSYQDKILPKFLSFIFFVVFMNSCLCYEYKHRHSTHHTYIPIPSSTYLSSETEVLRFAIMDIFLCSPWSARVSPRWHHWGTWEAGAELVQCRVPSCCRVWGTKRSLQCRKKIKLMEIFNPYLDKFIKVSLYFWNN